MSDGGWSGQAGARTWALLGRRWRDLGPVSLQGDEWTGFNRLPLMAVLRIAMGGKFGGRCSDSRLWLVQGGGSGSIE